MVVTNVLDVLSDGTIVEMELLVSGIVMVCLKRDDPDDVFSIKSIVTDSTDERQLASALREINTVLIENGVSVLTSNDLAGRQVLMTI